MAFAEMDTTALEDEAFDLEVSQDKCILRLISSCCTSDKFVKAGELMRLLSLEKSMRAAITLVTKLKLPFLAETFCSILEEKLLEEANDANANHQQSSSRGVVKSEVQNSPAPVQTRENTGANLIASAPKPSATTLVRKAKVSEGLKLGKEQIKRGETDDVKKREVNKLNLIKNPVNSVNNEDKDKGLRKEANQQDARPSSNPFLKSIV